MLIKCPNCGSTAQPKLIGVTTNPGCTIHELYKCGCDHKFIVIKPQVNNFSCT